eukprot:TRINITY_DN12810_c0_g1_i1.p1 TRINITY_DN12810_c0_g1~~TRINITY_DN12810_c0_g1_i1.p1  ORF type:complete len:532 (-),score=97.83 TRINITY_DN12810_c0_g1_i1:95-1663(-)
MDVLGNGTEPVPLGIPAPFPGPAVPSLDWSPLNIWKLVFLPISIGLIVVFSVVLKVHAFFALILVSIIYGLGVNLGTSTLPVITSGLGSTLGSITLIIICGTIIGNALLESNGALVLAQFILRIVGKKSVPIAAGYMGYVVSIAVFADSTFIILFPLVQAMVREAGEMSSIALMALAAGLAASHTMIPPTPGPLAAAAILGADLSLVIGFGFLVSFTGFQVALLFSLLAGSRIDIDHKESNPIFEDTEPEKKLPEGSYSPPMIKCIIPIILPVVLIVLQSVGNFPSHPFGDGIGYSFSQVIGNPSVALLLGSISSFFLLESIERRIFSETGVVGRSIKDSANIIFITGAGGAFGAVLKATQIADLIGTKLAETNLGILIPMLVAAGIKSAQGSSTVSIITTSSIVSSLLPNLGLTDPISRALLVVAIGGASLVFCHANDSLFWIISQTVKISIFKTFLTFTTSTAVLGISSSLFVVLFHYTYIGGGIFAASVFCINLAIIIWKKCKSPTTGEESDYLLTKTT